MKKRLFAFAFAALLLSGCGAGPAKTGAPKPAEAPAQTDVPGPTEIPKPTEAPKPAETPAPTGTPEPAETSAPASAPSLPELEGIYALYSHEAEGDFALASESGAEAWLLLRRDATADYMGPDADGFFREWRGMPVAFGADGALSFFPPEDFIAADMTGTADGEGALSLSLSWLNPDGSTGGTTLMFRRLRMPEGEMDGRPLSESELAELNAALDDAGRAFCTSVFSCPEEIDWRQVFYDGVGLSEDPGEMVLEEYRDAGGWGELDIEAVRDERVREFVWKHTLTSYDLADKPLSSSWFQSADGWYIFEHGDTNAIPVEFYAGVTDGERWQLQYRRSNYENYVFDEVPFVLTVCIRDGEWQYLSNLPADWTEPKPLLQLCYYADLEAAEAVNHIVSTVTPEQEPWMEPYDWSYAVITALTDDVRYIVERVEGYEGVGYDVLIPGDYVDSGVLRCGESVAVYTNQPWHAETRLTASFGSHYAAYVFGEDNWKHLLYGDARVLVGHDLAGERRGCAPRTEAELSNFLTDGNWALLDLESGEPVARVEFHDYRYLTVSGEERGFCAFLNYDRYDARPTEAPDMIALEYAEDFDSMWENPGYSYGDPVGEYQLHMAQLDGEQILTLTQVSDGRGILSDFCAAGDEGGCFTLHRFQGTVEMEAQG